MKSADSFVVRFPGLSATEVAKRSVADGTNRFATEVTRSYLRIIIDNAFPAANVALVTVSVVLVGLGLFIDALLTAGLVLGNTAVGVFQESRAKRQLDRIAVLARSGVRVIRDGKEQVIDSDDIVQGDIVVVLPGDQVQADGIVLAQDRCTFDESLLTGEADLVRKMDGDNLYSGSFCMGGRVVYRCERVGSEGLANQIAAKARAFRVVRTPLQREIGYVMWGMAVLVVLLAAQVVESFHDVYGQLPLVETARAAAVIIALIPQGLWVMVTVTYAMAIVRMSPLGTLVQRFNAIESMSHIDALCLDKTGTITTNALRLEVLHPIETEGAVLRSYLGTFCASASIGNRTNHAISSHIGGQARPTLAEVHFDAARKWSAMAFDDGGLQGLFVLGAPEIVGKRSKMPEAAQNLINAWSERGLRVLMFAWDPKARGVVYKDDEPELPTPLVPLGLVVLRDELRPGARETISELVNGGIDLKIISGDNPATVAALAREAGVPGADRIVSGLDLDVSNEVRLQAVAEENVIFGRISPVQKSSIVQALQRKGHYVAMIGDGVNDVPAMKQSQVAISMRSGSTVTRSIADIILLDDSFSALPAAFSEGRRIRKGMQEIVRLFLVRTLSVSIMIFSVVLLSSEFPLTPRHTAVLSALTVGIPSLFLALWAKPAVTGKYLIPSAVAFVAPAALLLGLMGTAVFEFALAREDLDSARTLLTSAAIVAGALMIPFVDDEGPDWITLRGLVNSPRNTVLAAMTLVVFGFTIYIGPLRQFYELTPVDFEDGLIVATGVIAWLVALAACWTLLNRGLRWLASRNRKPLE